MTDDEQFTAIFADYPDSAAMLALFERVAALHRKAFADGDGTIDAKGLERLRILAYITKDFADAVKMIETSSDPAVWIPF